MKITLGVLLAALWSGCRGGEEGAPCHESSLFIEGWAPLAESGSHRVPYPTAVGGAQRLRVPASILDEPLRFELDGDNVELALDPADPAAVLIQGKAAGVSELRVSDGPELLWCGPVLTRVADRLELLDLAGLEEVVYWTGATHQSSVRLYGGSELLVDESLQLESSEHLEAAALSWDRTQLHFLQPGQHTVGYRSGDQRFSFELTAVDHFDELRWYGQVTTNVGVTLTEEAATAPLRFGSSRLYCVQAIAEGRRMIGDLGCYAYTERWVDLYEEQNDRYTICFTAAPKQTGSTLIHLKCGELMGSIMMTVRP